MGMEKGCCLGKNSSAISGACDASARSVVMNFRNFGHCHRSELPTGTGLPFCFFLQSAAFIFLGRGLPVGLLDLSHTHLIESVLTLPYG
eukprot:4903838-Amphidinium_carterae.1